MAVTLSTAARNAAADAIVDLIDGGVADTAGDLVIMTSGDVEVATLVGNATPAFGTAASGQADMTLANFDDDTSATGGTAALFKFVNRDNTEIFRGTVGTSGADINLSSVTIGAGATVSLSSFTLTMPASP